MRVTVGVSDICTQLKDSARFSGSTLCEPDNVTESPVLTVWSAPAFAVGGAFALMTTSTVSVDVRPTPSVTVNLNLCVKAVTELVSTAKDGVSVSAPVRVTVGDADICSQLKASVLPSGSALCAPDSVTTVPSVAVWSTPAFAAGGALERLSPLGWGSVVDENASKLLFLNLASSWLKSTPLGSGSEPPPACSMTIGSPKYCPSKLPSLKSSATACIMSNVGVASPNCKLMLFSAFAKPPRSSAYCICAAVASVAGLTGFAGIVLNTSIPSSSSIND